MSVENLNKQQFKQTRLNALSAKYIHLKELSRWKSYNLVIDILTFIVPALLLIFPVLQVDLIMGITIAYINGLLSILLLVLAVLKLIIKIPDKVEKHQKLLTQNIIVANEAHNLLLDSPSQPNAEWLYRQALSLEVDDQEMIGNVNKELKQEAYRESLKELDLGNNSIVCPVCKASPWNFKKGSCEACGNTPANVEQNG